MNNSPIQYKGEFETVYSIITAHRERVARVVNNESMAMVWEVGGYVSNKLRSSAWGDGVVRMLAEFIHTKNPKAKGWSYRTIYKMVQLYDTYSTDSFKALVKNYGMQNYLPGKGIKKLPANEDTIVPIELAQLDENVFVPIELAQMPSVLFSTGWSNHQLIMSQCKSDEQRLFYILYSGNENPSIGILLCKDADMEVVRYALNRSMSPTMVAQYKEQLQVGGVIQQSLVEFCNFLNKGSKKGEMNPES